MTEVGRSIPHESAEAHATGEAIYTDDLVTRMSSLLHSWPVQSPHAHARVRSISIAPALEVPGVVGVLTSSDVPGENDIGPVRRDEPLFPEVAQHHGQAVAWVLAESEEAARDGATRVVVDWEPLEPVLGIDAAIAAESFLTDRLSITRGDPEAALAAAPRTFTGELFIGGQEHFYLETQAAIALPDESDGILVHSSTQHPSETQAIVARVLGVPKNRITVQCVRMGGAFGGKEVQANAWAAVAALGVSRFGRPVRVRLTREQDVVMTGKRHPFRGNYRVGFDDEGRLLGLVAELWSDGGWCLDLSEPVMYRAMFHLDNCYRIPHLAVSGRACRTHVASSTAFRGFGGPQGMLVIEEILDRVARSLHIEPHVVRERNFYREGDETHYGQPVRDASRIERIWRELRAESDFETRWQAIRHANRQDPDRKRGLAITPVKFGIAFTTASFNQAGAFVLIYQDGSVQLNHGGTEMGQGLHTKMRQVAADALGVTIDEIRIMPTRTDKVPNTSATAASSGSDLNGAAVVSACMKIKERLSAVAATALGTSSERVVFAAGRVYARSEERADAHDGDASVPTPDLNGAGLPFAEVVRRAHVERIPLFATGHYRTPDIHFDKATGRGKPFHYYAYGVAVTEVEIDGFTGQYKILRADILHDAGESLSPLVDLGQVEGAFVQGMGWLTMEELRWTPDGKVATRGASTYKLPTVGDCPEFHVRLLTNAREPGVVRGSKAVGEPPLMLAISVREALRQAVAAFGEDPGVVQLASPATPEAVYFAIESVRGAAPVAS